MILDCDDGWTHFETQCYQTSLQTLGLKQARNKCRKDNGTLVTIHSLTEHKEVVNMHLSHAGWLNGFLIENRWLWADGSDWNFQNWAEGEPKLGRDCLKITETGWVATFCNETGPAFTCKKEIKMNQAGMCHNIIFSVD